VSYDYSHTDHLYPRPRRRWPRRIAITTRIVSVLVGLGLVYLAYDLVTSATSTTPTVTSQPAVLTAIQDLSRFEAASGSYSVIVNLTDDNPFIPDFIYSRHVVFEAVGSVDVYVDFSTIGSGAVRLSSDGRSVTVTLPPPALEPPRLDHEKSQFVEQGRGIANAIGDLFDNDQNRVNQVYTAAEQQMSAAARDDQLQRRAEDNTRAMLTGLMNSLGITSVTVVFTGRAG
jgi:hypothetical protein